MICHTNLNNRVRLIIFLFFFVAWVDQSHAADEAKLLKAILGEVINGTNYELSGKALALDEIDHCFSLYISGWIQLKSSNSNENGIGLLKESASCGNIYAIRLLAGFFDKENLQKESWEKHHKWTRLGAELGDPVLSMNYALVLLRRENVSSADVRMAIGLLELAAKVGSSYSAYAYYQLGQIYSGMHVAEFISEEKAKDSFEEAAELGYGYVPEK